jgi:ketosteroid isomerase-like protein
VFGVLVLLALGIIGVFAAPSRAESQDEMLKAAAAMDKAFVAAFNKGDVDAVCALYWNSPEVVFYPPDAMEARGMDALRASMAAAMAMMAGGKMEMVDSHQMVAGDTVIGWGMWRFTAADGSVMNGRYTDVRAKRDGKWVYLVDHASCPMPAPPTE